MKSFKQLKSIIAENRYMVKFEKGGSMKLREYEASSAMAAESKAKVDAQRMGMTVASVRLKEVEKKTKDSPAMQESHQEVSADFKITASGKKVPVQRKTEKDELDDTDDKKEVKEDTEITEGTVKTAKYSWGTMKTVHHGADFSIPLHPEHHQAIHALKHGQEHKFKDETGHHWIAKRDKEKVHFQSADLHGGMRTSVKHSDLKEDVEQVQEAQEVHRVSVTVTDPHHPAVSMRGTKFEKRVKVKANDREHAIDSALHFYKKQGLKVHDHNYIGTVKEAIETTREYHLRQAKAWEKEGRPDRVKHHMDQANDWRVKASHDATKKAEKEIAQKYGSKHEEVEHIEEAADKEELRLIQLARLGLVDKANVSKLRMAIEQLKSDKPLSVAQRTLMLGVLEDLLSLVTGDDQVFMRLKRDVQKEATEKEDPPFDPDPPKKNPPATAGKYGQGYSTAKYLARLALQKQQKKAAAKAKS